MKYKTGLWILLFSFMMGFSWSAPQYPPAPNPVDYPDAKLVQTALVPMEPGDFIYLKVSDSQNTGMYLRNPEKFDSDKLYLKGVYSVKFLKNRQWFYGYKDDGLCRIYPDGRVYKILDGRDPARSWDISPDETEAVLDGKRFIFKTRQWIDIKHDSRQIAWPAYTADKKYIIYVPLEGNALIKYDIKKNKNQTLITGLQNIQHVQRTPDGKSILFHARVQKGTTDFNIYRLHLKTLKLEQLTYSPDRDLWPGINQEGTKVIYCSYNHSDKVSHFGVLDLRDKSVTFIPGSYDFFAYNPAWR